MSAPWWAAFPPAEAVISCGRGQHRLRWEQGRLVPADHPDPEGELVLAALGGGKADCVAVAETWGSHDDDLDVLVLGPRSAADELAIPRDFLEELHSGPHRGGRVGHAPPGRRVLRARPVAFPPGAPRPHPLRPAVPFPPGPGDEQIKRRTELLSLFALGPAFQWRLSGTVAWAWSREGSRARDVAMARPALVAALTGRLAPAVASWLGIDLDRVTASLHEGPGWGTIEVSGPGSEPSLHASLPTGWLARVWAPGLSVVSDHLVVEVLDVSWPHARVLALARPGGEPAVLSIRRDGEHWTVAGGGEHG